MISIMIFKALTEVSFILRFLQNIQLRTFDEDLLQKKLFLRSGKGNLEIAEQNENIEL